MANGLEVHSPQRRAAIARLSFLLVRSNYAKLLWAGAGFLMYGLFGSFFKALGGWTRSAYLKRSALLKMRNFAIQSPPNPEARETVYTFLESIDRMVRDYARASPTSATYYDLYHPEKDFPLWFAVRVLPETQDVATKNNDLVRRALNKVYEKIAKASQEINEALQPTIPRGYTDDERERLTLLLKTIALSLKEARVEAYNVQLKTFEEIRTVTANSKVPSRDRESEIPTLVENDF